MLEQLSKKDKKWRNIALKICKNRQDADDLVNDMYVKVHDVFQTRPNIEMKDSYIYRILFNMFLENCRVSKARVNIPLDEIVNLSIEENTFELDDESLLLLKRASKLRALYRDCLILGYDMSLREIEAYSGVNYGFAYRAQKKARQDILKGDYDKYKNRRNKRL